MDELRLRLDGIRRRLRASLWFVPSVGVVLALVAAELLGRVRPVDERALLGLVVTGSADTAATILQTIATALITVTGLTFSTAVVALQVATGQYTPRLLRNFLADRGNQTVLAGLVATFTYALVLLRRVRGPGQDGEEAVVPVVGVTIAVLLALGCVALLVYFFHHVTTQLRVEAVMADVAEQTLATIDVVHPERDDDHTPVDLPEPPDDAVRLLARRSGHLQTVDLDRMLEVARRADVNVRLRPWVGDHVTVGTTLAWVWPADGERVSTDTDDLEARLHRTLDIGRDRSLEFDVAFGMREIVDIAVRAMSPAVNDPTTAVLAVQELTSVLVRLGQRRLDDSLRHDGPIHVSLPRPDFRAYLALAQDQIRRAGAREPAVAVALLRQLRDVAETIRDPQLLPVLDERADAVVAAVRDAGLGELDQRAVLDAREHLERVEEGRADPEEAAAD